jgi:CelD/BcsL family acetyltransferase involved in cellulose biosynthesis
MGTLYKNIFYLNNTSYDATYKRYEPGTILFIRMIEDIIKSGATEIDFGFGDAFYKQRFGNHQWQESSVYIYAPTIKGIGLNLIRSITIKPYRYAMRLAEETNILQKIKTFWRNKLRTQKEP